MTKFDDIFVYPYGRLNTSDIYGHSLRSVEDIAAEKLEAMLEPVAQIREGQE